MSKFELFDFTPEIIDSFRENHEIPVHFYNKDGQVLIHKKEDASEAEIDRLLRFVKQGIYYDIEDSEKLGISQDGRDIPEGLTDTKLLDEQITDELNEGAKELFQSLKRTSITSVQARKTSERLAGVFDAFESQPDMGVGLVNILELMGGRDNTHDVELAVKRTVVAMALKTRGTTATGARDRARLQDAANVLMMSALLCDIGYGRMNMPEEDGLSDQQMNYIRNHPIMSYLMIAHERSIDPRVKRNVLSHHRPMKAGTPGNNYPSIKNITARLNALKEKYEQDPARRHIAEDIDMQLKLLVRDLPYDEDAAILAIASEFASLTSRVPWREPFSARRAVQMIVNNSYFTYPDRIVREFLDYVSISLCNNEKILKEGDFIIVAMRSGSGKTFFEVGQITNATRFQSKPGMDRFATIYPEIGRSPKFQFLKFPLEGLKPDPRKAHYELSKDDSRHIVYAVDPTHDPDLYEELFKLTRTHVPGHEGTGSVHT
ncbi:MAG: c-di-GMP phosphodiesterase [Leptospiraceae bacterium]|nr:c-di-GMP phosphodiesterase [Leptospiraceae bacterium]